MPLELNIIDEIVTLFLARCLVKHIGEMAATAILSIMHCGHKDTRTALKNALAV